MRHLATLVVLAFVGCGPSDVTPGASGTGTVSGTALGLDFTFGPSRVVATHYAASTTRSEILEVRLCERSCDPLGVVLSSSSRAVILAVQAQPSTALTSIATTQVSIGSGANGLAVFRGVQDPTDATTTLRLEHATAGQVVLTSVDPRAGGRAVGSYSIQLKGGGLVSGEFDAPVLESP